MILRREFITLLGCAAVWPLAASAQQAGMPVVGFGTEDTQRRYLAEIHRGLSAIGYIVGRNLAVESRWAEDRYDRLPALADELVRRKVSVIIPLNTAALFAAKAATQSIPIVFMTGIDPVGGREAALAGGLVAYGTDFPPAYNQVGMYAGRILKGEKPGDLPVQQGTKMLLTINMRRRQSDSRVAFG
jgi:ABC-type uncharacterized transport system substrate-binding protein